MTTLRSRYKKVGAVGASPEVGGEGSIGFVNYSTDFSNSINCIYTDPINANIEQEVTAPVGSVIHVVNANPNLFGIVLFNDEWADIRNVAGVVTPFVVDRGLFVARNTSVKFVRISATQLLLLEGAVSQDWIPSRKPAGIELTWQSNGDANGAMYYLGTLGLVTSFANPDAVRNAVLCSASAGFIDQRVPNKMVDRSTNGTNGCWHSPSGFSAGNWIQIRLLNDKTLVLNRYTLQASTDHGWPSYWSTFSFQASQDGTTWDTIQASVNPGAVGSSGFYNSGMINNIIPYSYFRWTSLVSLGYGVMGEVELYGTLSA
jgi:hypothetical protein